MASEPTREELEEEGEIERKSFELAVVHDDLAGALKLIDDYLAAKPRDRLRAGALAHRAILLEMHARLDEAKASLLDAHSLSAGPNYQRYGIELGLVQIAEKTEDDEGRRHWSRAALRTVAEDPSTNGASAALSFVELSGGAERLSSDELADVGRIIQNAWRLWKMEGEPDLSDIRSLLTRLRGNPPRGP